MIITQQNRETVIQTFREYPAGLSISDLSLKSGINRNKCSQICSDYHKSDILGLIQKSSYKIYFLKHQSVLTQIIDSISGPVLVVNESFAVIAINKEYVRSFGIHPDEILGRSAEELLVPLYPDLIQVIKEQTGPGMSGKTATFPDETGVPRCKTLTIALNESQFCIIILQTQAPLQGENDTQISTAESRFTAAVPGLMAENTWPQALGQITRLLHETIPDALIFTLLIEEPLRTCMIHTLASPAGWTEPEISGVPIPMTGIEILQYKTREPTTYYTGTPESLSSTPLPKPLRTMCQEKGISSISLLGISSNGNSTTVLGIGTEDSSVSIAHVRLLQSLSGYLNLLCTLYHRASDMQNIKAGHQKHYSEIYALLTEKTQENAALITGTQHLISVLETVLDSMKISLISVNRQGALITANKTASTVYSISGQDLADNVPITNVLSPELAASLLALIPDQTSHSPGTAASHIEEQQTGRTHWYLIPSHGTQQETTYLYVGEKHPAHLIKYLKSINR
ncbi:PAS domain-containing protein [uncultured Methanospirillum sp.]|uniref:PAS domain-containing protein n=1 Tax=uncultured Methanospirillum sp. TaxID=262503 RepID=UPI0029C708EB|nr:PAS domain-containing protein [uncultured Methanospirillum sp.]